MSERMIEVVCPQVLDIAQPESTCPKCGGSGVAMAYLAPGTRSAAMWELAEAWLAHDDASAENRAVIGALDTEGDGAEQLAQLNRVYLRCKETRKRFLDAVDAVRAFDTQGEDPDRTCERYDAAIVRYEQALAAARILAPEVPR